jgi:hypothetical protein
MHTQGRRHPSTDFLSLHPRGLRGRAMNSVVIVLSKPAGCIACDRNEVEECFSTCSHQPTNGAKGPQEDGVGVVEIEETIAAYQSSERIARNC